MMRIYLSLLAISVLLAGCTINPPERRSALPTLDEVVNKADEAVEQAEATAEDSSAEGEKDQQPSAAELRRQRAAELMRGQSMSGPAVSVPAPTVRLPTLGR